MNKMRKLLCISLLLSCLFAITIAYADIDVGDAFSCGLAKYKVNDKWGYIDTTGAIVIPAQWDYVSEFYDGLASVFVGTTRQGLFEEIPDIGQNGVINLKGEYIIPLTWCDSISTYNAKENGIVISYKNGDMKWTYEYWNIDGTKQSSTRWDNSFDASSGLRCVCKDGKWGYIDLKGNTVIGVQFDYASPFNEGLACVAVQDAKGYLSYYYIDPTGQTAISNKGWDYADWFRSGANATTVCKSNKYAIIDTAGNFLTDYIFDDVSYFSDGLLGVAISKNGNLKWGFVNEKGEYVVQPTWDYVDRFSNGMASVYSGTVQWGFPSGGVYGCINAEGQLISELQWSKAIFFSKEGLAIVSQSNAKGVTLYGMINTEGRIIIPVQWDSIRGFQEELAVVSKGGKYGYVDKEGNLVIDTKWDKAGDFSDGVAIVWKDSEWFIIDKEGNVVF